MIAVTETLRLGLVAFLKTVNALLLTIIEIDRNLSSLFITMVYQIILKFVFLMPLRLLYRIYLTYNRLNIPTKLIFPYMSYITIPTETMIWLIELSFVVVCFTSNPIARITRLTAFYRNSESSIAVVVIYTLGTLKPYIYLQKGNRFGSN